MKLTILSKEHTQDSEFRSFLVKIVATIICLRDLLTFRTTKAMFRLSYINLQSLIFIWAQIRIMSIFLAAVLWTRKPYLHFDLQIIYFEIETSVFQLNPNVTTNCYSI